MAIWRRWSDDGGTNWSYWTDTTLPLVGGPSSDNGSSNRIFQFYATGADVGRTCHIQTWSDGVSRIDWTFVLPLQAAPAEYGPYNQPATTDLTYNWHLEAQIYFEHGTISEGVTVTPGDHTEITWDGDIEITVNGDVGTRYQVQINGVNEGPEFLGFGSFELFNCQENKTLSVSEVGGGIVEAPSYAESGRLVLFGKDGGADSQGFSIPDWSAGGVYLIPPTGTIGVHPDIQAGFWKQVGFRSLDGRPLPPGNWVVQVYSNEAWVDVAGYVIGENQHSSGVSDCFISKSGMREFRIRMAVDSQAPDPPTWDDLPSDGGTAGQEETTPVELTPEGEFPEIQVEKPTPPTWEDEPEITEPNTSDCPCSPWYVDIAEQIQWVGYQLSTELEYVGDSIQWVGDVLDQRLEEQSQELRGIREALELIADRLPIEVAIEAQPPYSIQYPGGPEADVESFMDGRY